VDQPALRAMITRFQGFLELSCDGHQEASAADSLIGGDIVVTGAEPVRVGGRGRPDNPRRTD
jgi:hypothetical protein